MKRYRLTKSGVCDCMLPDDNGPWVKYEDAEQAHRAGWEQAKREAVKLYCNECGQGCPRDALCRDICGIVTMEYKEPSND